MSEPHNQPESTDGDEPTTPPAVDPPPPPSSTPAPPPPTTGASTEPTQPPAPMPHVSPPPPHPAQPVGRAKGTFDTGVLAIAAVTVLLLAGLVFWGGGDAASGGTGGLSPTAPNVGGSGSGSGGGSGGMTASPSASGTSDPPFDTSALGSIGSPTAPIDPRAVAAWKVPRTEEVVLAELKKSFPVSGYELRKSMGTSTKDGAIIADTWLIKPVGVEMTYQSRTLTFRVDPNDPASTIVEYQGST